MHWTAQQDDGQDDDFVCRQRTEQRNRMMDRIMALPAVSPHSPSFVQRNNSCYLTAECLFCHHPVALREQSPCTLQPIIILYFLSVIILCFPPSSCALRAIILSKCQKQMRGKKNESSCNHPAVEIETGWFGQTAGWSSCHPVLMYSYVYKQNMFSHKFAEPTMSKKPDPDWILEHCLYKSE